MTRRPLVALAAALVTLTGCGIISPKPAATPTAASGLGDSVKNVGIIPCPCTLLDSAEVTSLTGRDVSSIDEDGLPDGDENRYCQWQQPAGQLAVFLNRTTAADFQVKTAEAAPVDGVGEEAFTLAGHLYVLYGTVSIDVYNRGDSDEQNLAKAKKIAEVLIPRI